MAKTVMSWPAAAVEMSRSDPMAGSSPAMTKPSVPTAKAAKASGRSLRSMANLSI